MCTNFTVPMIHTQSKDMDQEEEKDKDHVARSMVYLECRKQPLSTYAQGVEVGTSTFKTVKADVPSRDFFT